MVQSDYVFEEGDAIDVGNPVENDFVFDSGDLVSDNNVSRFAYIRERSIGPPSNVLHYVYNTEADSEGNVHSDFHTDISNQFGYEVDYNTNSDGTLDEFILDKEYPFVIITVRRLGSNNSIYPTQNELDALSTYWSDTGRVIVQSENSAESGGDVGDRIGAANDLINAAIGDSPFDGSDDKDDTTCYLGSVIPTDEHPAFDGVQTLGRRPDEALIGVNSTPSLVTPVYNDSNNSWGYYESGDKRLWADGAQHVFDEQPEPGYNDCEDNDKYATQLIDWILGA